MKITIELNKVKVSKDIPISWDEVTFRQFLELAEAGNDRAKILSVFTGIEPETLRKSRITNFDKINTILGFVERNELNITKIPDKVLGYKIPKNLELETIGQFEDLKLQAKSIKDNSKESLSAYTRMCAIYSVTPYDWSEAERIAPYFMDAPCGEVLAVGNFTLMKLMPLSESGLKRLLKPNSILKKSKLAMTAWINRLAFTVRYSIWKRKLRLTESSSLHGL
jgi:hypothetical protein